MDIMKGIRTDLARAFVFENLLRVCVRRRRRTMFVRRKAQARDPLLQNDSVKSLLYDFL